MSAPIIITSRENTKIKYVCKLIASAAFRQSEKSFVAEGLKLCVELTRGASLHAVFYTQKALTKTPSLAQLCGEQYLIEEHVAEKIAQSCTNQGVFAVFKTPEVQASSVLKTGGRFLALEQVQDPGNVGTLLRSAVAFGFDAVLLSKGCASPFAPKTLRASMGAVGQIAIVEGVNLPETLAQMREYDITSLAAALYHSEPLGTVHLDKTQGVCVVIGSEGQGLKDETIAACDKAVRIPMTDRIESLNAGIAGSLLLWEFRGGGL